MQRRITNKGDGVKRIIVSVFSAAVLLAGTASFAIAEKGASNEKAGDRNIPAAVDHHANNECDTSVFTTSSTSYVAVPGSTVSVSNNFGTTRDTYVNFTSETSSSTAGTRIDIAYRIDGGSAQVVGAEFGFRRAVNTLPGMGTHTGVIHVPAGTHTITPMVRIVGGGSGTLWFRCMHARVAGTTS